MPDKMKQMAEIGFAPIGQPIDVKAERKKWDRLFVQLMIARRFCEMDDKAAARMVAKEFIAEGLMPDDIVDPLEGALELLDAPRPFSKLAATGRSSP